MSTTSALFSRIMIVQWDFDGTETSLFYCKIRLYFTHVFIGTSLACMWFEEN